MENLQWRGEETLNFDEWKDKTSWDHHDSYAYVTSLEIQSSKVETNWNGRQFQILWYNEAYHLHKSLKKDCEKMAKIH